MSKDKKKHHGLKSLTRVLSKRFHRRSKDEHSPDIKSESPPDELAEKKNPQKENKPAKAMPSIRTEPHTKEIHALPTTETAKQPQTLPAMTATGSDLKKQLGTSAKAHRVKASEWDDIFIPSDEEEEKGENASILSSTATSLNRPKTKLTTVNDWFEKYVPGWRFLSHNLFRPMMKYNLEAADSWVEKLFSFLPFGKQVDSLVSTTVGFLPMYNQTAQQQQQSHAKLNEDTKPSVKPRI